MVGGLCTFLRHINTVWISLNFKLLFIWVSLLKKHLNVILIEKRKVEKHTKTSEKHKNYFYILNWPFKNKSKSHANHMMNKSVIKYKYKEIEN